ncbi:MAG: DUF4954 family protein [Planctomycetota bacterium]|jgi:hypothetical protein
MKFGQDIDVIECLRECIDTSTFLKTIKKVNRGIFPESDLRNLTSPEINHLKSNGNIASSWESIRVTAKFTPDPIMGCTFLGKAVIGSLQGEVDSGGFPHASGLINSTFYDVQIDDSVLIKNVMTLSSVTVMKGASIVNCHTVSHGEDNHFGIGKELSLAIENGGREIRIFPEINIDVARIICSRRNDKKLLSDYDKLIDEYRDKSESPWSIVMPEAKIWNCAKVLNIYLGESATLDNVCCVKNTVIISSKEEPATIEDGAYVADSVVQWGCHITTGATASNSIFTEYSSAALNAKVLDSLIGSNTEIAEGEATSSLVGSFVGFHHQALLISAFWPEGKGNVSYGANIGSNHTGKEPDQEIWPGEGTFFGLGSSVKFPTDFTQGPYSIIATGVLALAQKMMFPFSLINNPTRTFTEISPAFNEIIPAWVLTDNIFTIWRNVEKYKARNKAKRITIKYDIFRPSIIDKMLDARKRLQEVKETKEVYTDRDISGLGKNYMFEKVRQPAIDTYTFYARYYCLNELYREIKRRIESGESKLNADSLFDLKQKNEIWQHASSLWSDLIKSTDIANCLEQLVKIKLKIADNVKNCKSKDDNRGMKIIRDYEHSHVKAEDNKFVLKSYEEAEQFERDMENITKYL